MTATLLRTRKDRLRALGVTAWDRKEASSDVLRLAQAPSGTRWLFLWAGSEDMQAQSPAMALFTAILRALGESPETVAWGEVCASVSPAAVAARFPALKTVVLLGAPASQYFIPTQISSVIPAWGGKFRLIVAAGLSELPHQTDAKRWLWQQLQTAQQ